MLHRSQIGSLLGLHAPDEGDATLLARDCAVILDAWVRHLDGLPFALLRAPTPSRGRSLRNLTVNVFHPFELLPFAPSSRRFDWDPAEDDEREAALTNAETVRAYARHISAGWHAFLLQDDLGTTDEIASPRGPISWPNLLAHQRWHAAYHYRQLIVFLGTRGRPVSHPLRLEGLAGLDLPAEVY